MRTTLTLDADVAAAIERLRSGRDVSLKEIVNRALRAGLAELEAADDQPPATFHTDTVDLGGIRQDVTDISEALAAAEGEDRR